MLSVSPSFEARSSLEAMLESLRQRQGNENTRDLPPELPVRPRPKARTRPPSFRKPLTKSSTAPDAGMEKLLKVGCKKEEVKSFRGNNFCDMREMEAFKSPYLMEDSKGALERGHGGGMHARLPQGPLPRFLEFDRDDNIAYFIKKKLRIWCRQQNGLWESGKIQSTSGEKSVVFLSDERAVTVPTSDLLPANPDILEGVDDLTQLSYLNEPSVLHNLKTRYIRGAIYSKAGPVLVAVNPFKDAQVCGDEFVTAYMNKLMDSPHVYAIADTAYNQMMEGGVNQSIIISGESGSGKTETAKMAMQYLAAVGGGSNGIESEVLQTNCILEAFGNAKTSRNDNSSRFGKLIEIHFSVAGKISGAKLNTFLLEKSRVVQCAQGERSYHIFYQLCAGAPSGLRDKLKLKDASEFNYLKHSSCLVISGVDDAKKFQILMEALNRLEICQRDQLHAFQMISAVLWLGNISFEVIDNENHVEPVANEAVMNAASLMGCSAYDLMLALSTHKIQAGKDEVSKRLTTQQAIDSRDSLAKFIYGSLFEWVVDKINTTLAMGKQHTGRSINILDIYGFESFENNGFEQFCINYANERLQQHFNSHLFKREQEEYELDGIDWRKIEFKDNQDCLDLIEQKPFGLIALLDEESNFPKATDLTFANKLQEHLKTNSCLKGERGSLFSIQHYAGEVMYSASGFLEKNRDLLHSDIIQLLSSCSSELLQLFTSLLLNQFQKSTLPSKLAVSDVRRQSVATKFKGQLFQLMQQLENTAPHFIRCIKPNNKKLPGMFEKDIVLQQLQCCGILEVVRISRAGYPTRMTHQDFTGRYAFLLSDNSLLRDPLKTSVAILQKFHIHPEMYQVGYTKLYLRAGQIAAMEDVRKQVLQGTLDVQKCFRGYRTRLYFHELKGGVITLQSFVRGEIDRKRYDVLIKSKVDGDCKKQDERSMAVLRIQSAIRGFLSRRHFGSLWGLKKSILNQQNASMRISGVKDLPSEVLPYVLEELQKQVHRAEATIEQKEKENVALRQQIKQFENRLSEYEAKMGSVEMWQKQMASLQAKLALAKCLTVGGNTLLASSQLSHSYESTRSLSMGTGAGSASMRSTDYETDAAESVQEGVGGFLAVSHLVKEFEVNKQKFDGEAERVVQLKGQPTSIPEAELKRLKIQFCEWKEDFKERLRETRAKLRKLEQHSKDRRQKRTTWWGKEQIFSALNNSSHFLGGIKWYNK
ncbi:unnamed protein product [Cuscuta epithymum]|uniref:Myosin-2 n=1 Tax=Cuscuta epithymum TaxID=186058 RepID=A0AAV0FJ20_9ASTE|nr:unnamed protein product [Cuscuta epithymum]